MFSSGPDNAELVAWDQVVRYLPVEISVEPGLQLELTARHDHAHLASLCVGRVPPETLAYSPWTSHLHHLVDLPAGRSLGASVETRRC